jgi:hypothetical protein
VAQRVLREVVCAAEGADEEVFGDDLGAFVRLGSGGFFYGEGGRTCETSTTEASRPGSARP